VTPITSFCDLADPEARINQDAAISRRSSVTPFVLKSYRQPRYPSVAMLRLLRIFAQLLVLIIVALAAALISMRFAIHGREVSVPDFRGMAPTQAERIAYRRGLEFACTERFYSATVPAGRIVSQQPDPGTRVRGGWHVRTAESLGPQRIDIPSVIGLSPRAAEIDIRRRGLEVGDSAELADAFAFTQSAVNSSADSTVAGNSTAAFAHSRSAAGVSQSGPAGRNAIPPIQTVIAQSPAPAAQGVASPRISLLYSGPVPETAYVMPDLTGLSLAAATRLATGSGLRVASITSEPAAVSSPAIPGSVSAPAELPAPDPRLARIVGQTPPAGTRVTPDTDLSFQVTRGQ
jgi:beta-lactam-binding protein with PASTA domain